MASAGGIREQREGEMGTPYPQADVMGLSSAREGEMGTPRR